jgi:hypothetical protein
MKILRTILMLLAVPALAGCASFGAGKTAARPSSEAAAEEGAILGGLADASLPAGACGMVLWTLDAQRPVPVFRFVAGRTAELVVNGAAVSLQRVEADGASSYGVFEDQTFLADNGLRVDVGVRFSLGFDGGSYLERGLIKVESVDGWRTVVPSAGLAGCRSK